MKTVLYLLKIRYLICALLPLLLADCATSDVQKEGCASHVDDASVDYQGPYQLEVTTLLSRTKPWRIATCKGKTDGLFPAKFGNGCVRDGYVDGAIQLAWAVEYQWRTGQKDAAVANAALVRQTLDNADALCSNVPTVDCPGCECGTSKIWPCTNTSGGGPGGSTGGSNGSTAGKGTIIIENTTFTDLEITLGGQTSVIPPGQKFNFQSTPNSSVSYSAKTSGKTSDGTIIGLELTWSGTATYPAASQTSTLQFSASGDYFFLKLANKSGVSWTKTYVNYGLQAQTLDNITIPNDNQTYSIGYYKAYSNSNVRTEAGKLSWSWTNLGLTASRNQSVTLVGN